MDIVQFSWNWIFYLGRVVQLEILELFAKFDVIKRKAPVKN